VNRAKTYRKTLCPYKELQYQRTPVTKNSRAGEILGKILSPEKFTCERIPVLHDFVVRKPLPLKFRFREIPIQKTFLLWRTYVSQRELRVRELQCQRTLSLIQI